MTLGLVLASCSTEGILLAPVDHDLTVELDLATTSPPADLASADDLAADGGTAGSLCSFANLALCDGFEAAKVQIPPWQPVEHFASVTVDTTHAARGDGSLHLHVEPIDMQMVGQAELTETVVFPSPVIFVRFFVFLPVLTDPGVQARLVGALQLTGAVDGVALSMQADQLQIGDTQGTAAESGLLTAGRWTCIELMVSTDPMAGESRVFVDDVEISALHRIGGTQYSPGLERLSIGAAFFATGRPAQPAFDLWMDEVAADSQRITCQR